MKRGAVLIIEQEKSNTILEHFKTFLSFRYDTVCGTQENGNFVIWRMTIWSGLFYPVVKGKIDFEKNKVKIDSIQLNPAGKLIKRLLLAFLTYGLLVHGIFNAPYEWKAILFKLIIGILIFACYFSFFAILSYSSKKAIIEEFKNNVSQ